MPNPDDFDKADLPQTSMLDDLLATDRQEITGPITPSHATVPEEDGPQPLDLNRLNAGDFSMIVTVLMQRLGVKSCTITQEDCERATAVPAGQAMVLAACIDDQATLYLATKIGPKSEFRS